MCRFGHKRAERGLVRKEFKIDVAESGDLLVKDTREGGVDRTEDVMKVCFTGWDMVTA